MGVEGLRKCRDCGHVQNHHGGHGCHIAGCLCRRFVFGGVSLERHNEVVREANRRIMVLRAERDELRARLAAQDDEGRPA